MNRAMKLTTAGIIFFCVTASIVSAEAQTTGSAPRLSPVQGARDLGLIFSADDLLMGLESYEAGLGIKIGRGNRCLRGALDFVVNGASNSFSVNAGGTGEFHLAPPPISPYIGGFAQIGYMKQGTSTSAIPFSLGAVAGVEVFIFDFLSVFAEYNLAFNCTLTTDLQTSQTSFDYLIDTRMGNNSKLGIVVYFMRMGAKK